MRLLDVHAPERSEPGGPETTQFVAAWLAAVDLGRRWPLVVRTDPSSLREPTERRTFVRYLATVYRAGVAGRSLNDDVTAFLAAHPGWGPGQ